MKRYLSLILIFIMLLSSVPSEAFAAPPEGYSYAGESPEMYAAEHDAVILGGPSLEYDAQGTPVLEVYTLMVEPEHDLKKTEGGETKYYRLSPAVKTSACENHYDVWHSSSDLWRIGKTGDQVPDKDVETKGGITNYLEQTVDSINFAAPIPKDVQAAISEGRFKGLSISSGESIRTDRIAESIDYQAPKAGDASLPFSIVPKFHLRFGGNTLTSYENYGGNDYISLIDILCGFNLWAVYDQNGADLGQAKAIFSYGDGGTSSEEGAVQLAQVLDEGGRLKAGYRIKCVKNGVSRTYDTAGLRIGSDEGIYQRGGAVGYSFRYIFSVRWEYSELREIPPEEYIFDKAFPLVRPDDPRTFRVTYLPGGGSGTMIDPNEYRPGDPVTVLENGFIPPEGKEFAYFLAFDGSLRLEPGQVWNIPSDAELTAVWKDKDAEQPPAEGPMDVDARLILPETGFEGHAVFARDASVITQGGSEVPLVRAYAEKTAESDISAPGASSSQRQSFTEVKLVYDTAGTYDVTLEVSSDDASDTDTRSIEIKKTPAITAVLGGKQKENRKQTLDVVCAQDPRSPVNSLTIRITDPESGESVTVDKNFSGAEAAPVNSEHIKYRSLENMKTGPYYCRVRLSFLTKFRDARTLTYEIHAADSRGSADTVTAEFTVLPDEAPAAAIDIAESYYRGISSNTARIDLRDATLTDGDQLDRQWQIAPAGDGSFGAVNTALGFGDDSFGALQAVHFTRTGVGWFDVRLRVTDVWTEETLPEYVTAADYRSSEVTARSHVDNIAPEVLLSLKKAKTAEILLVSGTRRDQERALGLAPQIYAGLLKDSIAADVKTVRLPDPARVFTSGQTWASIADEGLDALATHSSGAKLSYENAAASSAFWGTGGGMISRKDELNLNNKKATRVYELFPNAAAATDGIRLFVMRSSLAFGSADGSVSYYGRSYPFTLECYDLFEKKSPEKLWSATITEAVFPSPDCLFNARMIAGGDTDYMYLVENGRSLMIDKRTGAFVKTIPAEMEDFTAAANGSVYTVKDDGIWRLSPSGAFTRIIACTAHAGFEKAAMFEGKIHFVMEKDLVLQRAVFDPKTESFTASALPQSGPAAATGLLKGRCIGADPSGRIVIWYDTGTVRYYDPDGACGVIAYKGVGKNKSVVTARDETGLIKAVVLSWQDKSSGKNGGIYYCYTAVYDLQKGKVAVNSENSSYYYRYDPSCVALAEAGGGTLRFTCGPGHCDVYMWPDGTFAESDPAGTVFYDMEAETFSFSSGAKGWRFADRSGGLNAERMLSRGVSLNYLVKKAADPEALKDLAESRLLGKGADYSYVFSVDPSLTAASAASAVTEGGETLASLSLKTSKASGSLSRAMTLDPSATYYYEYDTDAGRDILSVSGSAVRSPGSLSPRYTVTEEHVEDFSKGSISGFFTGDASNISYSYSSGRLGAGGGCYAMPARAEGGISFTIPQGKQAVLSFRFAYTAAAKDPAVTLEKESARTGWSHVFRGELASVNSRSSGTYYFDELIGPGTYRLGRDEGTGLSIDDLTVSFVEPSSAAVPSGTFALKKESSAEKEGSVYHVTGSFTTAPSTLGFAAVSGLAEETATEGTYTTLKRTTNRSGGWYERLTFAPPAGMRTVYIEALGSSSAPSKDGDVVFALEDARFENYTDGEDTDWYDTAWTVPRGKTSVRMTAKSRSLDPAGGGSGSLASSIKVRTAHAQFDSVRIIFAPKSGGAAKLFDEEAFMVSGGEVLAPSAESSGSTVLSFEPGKAGTTRISGLRIYRIEDGERVYLTDTAFTEERYLTGWTAKDAEAVIAKEEEKQDQPRTGRIYKKGETVLYSFSYYDYEADPQKEGFYRYTHEPLNDGLNPISGQILTAPVSRFYVDGKYTVEHWVTDRAGRDSGITDFDRTSNTASAVFYIQGTLPENEAPVVRTIRTSPGTLKAGDGYNIAVKVDDPDKDILTVKLELYRDGASVPVFTGTKTNVRPGSGGAYAELTFTGIPDAEEGGYEAVVTVSDGEASAIKNYLYVVKVRNSLTGAVTHTGDWENNRQTYNFNNFKDRGKTLYISDFARYKRQDAPRKRGTNVFWAGEALQLNAPVEGKAVRVTASLSGTSWSASLRRTGQSGTSDNVVTWFEGELWDKGMIGGLAKNGPEQRTVTFTAVFEDGETLTYPVTIIFDDDDPYWMLHRAY
ncbi:MAG: hypothetical protein IJL27_02865 [Firmicutes bacterium]|nr:hypothetical protein [Bacillota bacterium]